MSSLNTDTGNADLAAKPFVLPEGTDQFGFNVLEAITDAFVAFDRNWRFVYANAAARKIADRELVGLQIWESYPELIGTPLHEAYLRAMSEQHPVQLEYFHPKTNRWIELRAFATADGLAVFFRDISQQKKRDSDLEESELQFRKLADAMPQIAWSATRTGEIEFLNARWYEFTGQDPSRPVWEQYSASVHPDDAAKNEEGWANAVKEGLAYECEVRIASRTGEYRWHLSRMVPVRNESGEVERFYGTSTDIHDRKIMEERLALGERRFQVALSGAQITAFEQDEELRYTWIYPPLEREGLETLGKREEEVWSPNAAKELTEVKQLVLKSGKGARKTVEVRMENGARYYDLMVEPLREEAGKVIGVTGAALDVTDRRQAENALRESEERFRQAIEKSPIPKIIHAEDGEIIHASRAWIEATGYAATDTKSVDDWIKKVGSTGADIPEVFRSAFTTSVRRDDAAEYRIKTRSGHELIWIITSAPLGVLPDGRRLAVTAGIDITARKWAEEGQRFLTQAGHTLAESLDYQETLGAIARLAVPGLADWCGVDILEEDGNLKRLAVAHVDPDKVKWALDLQEKYPFDPEAPSGVANVLRTGKPELVSEITQEMIDAANLDEELVKVIHQIDLASMVVVPLLARGEVLGAISFVSSVPGRYQAQDVAIFQELGQMAGLAIENARLYSSVQAELAERTRIEEEIRHLNESLNERVLERTAELEAANREMEGFTYSVSHDLRAPLRAIMSTSMILLEEAAHALSDQERALLERQASAAKKMGILIDELLKLSRLSRQELTFEPLDLSQIADDVALELKGDGRANGINFEIERNLKTRGDVRLLRFVLLNLMENASKFSPRGGTVTIGKEGDSFFVRDEGIGFDMSYAHKLFLPFERLVNESEYPGTGIGLANVQRIVQRHGGHVWAVSEPGKGATFYFSL